MHDCIYWKISRCRLKRPEQLTPSAPASRADRCPHFAPLQPCSERWPAFPQQRSSSLYPHPTLTSEFIHTLHQPQLAATKHFGGKLPPQLSPRLVQPEETGVSRNLYVSCGADQAGPCFSVPFSLYCSRPSVSLGDKPGLLPVLLIYQHTPAIITLALLPVRYRFL